MCATIVCFSSVGRGLQPEVDVIVVCIHFGSLVPGNEANILVEGMPIQMYGETQFVDLQVRTIYGWMRNGSGNSMIVESYS